MIVDAARYVGGQRVDLDAPGSGADDGTGRDSFAWIGLRMPTSAELGEICRAHGLPDLAYDEVVRPHVRPVLTIDGDIVHLVLRTAAYQQTQRTVSLGELSVIAGPTSVISVRFGQATPLSGLRRRLEADPERLALGPRGVVAAIITEVVSGYRPALDGFEQAVVELEADVFSDRPRRPIKRLYQLKRDVRTLLLAIEALEDPLARLTRHSAARDAEEVVTDLQEALEQLGRAVGRAESLSDLLDATLSATLAQIGVQQNDDMRRISAWVATAAAPTLIAGIYGMNFDTFPELRWRYGYPTSLALMLLSALLLLRAFRRSGWL